jgi:hypothetical protein
MIPNCRKKIKTENLLINYDISDINSWNLNEDLEINSLNSWGEAIVSNISLCDYGLTMFDNGNTINMNENKYFVPTNILKLNPIKYNVLSGITSGNTFQNVVTITEEISGITGDSFGNYFQLNGGYLNNFFKLQEYDYQLLPIRFNNGFTVETQIKILPESEGMFLYLGTRAEDKYNSYFNGEVYEYTSEKEESYRTGNLGETQTFTYKEKKYGGVKTSTGDLLYSLVETNERKLAFRDFNDQYKLIYENVNQLDNVSYNALGFYLTPDKKIGYKYLKHNALLSNNTSNNSIDYNKDPNLSGWTTVSIAFTPYTNIEDYEESNALCYPRRMGDLNIYVNGRSFWKIENFEEFYFKPIQNTKEKVIGVPYNISWGGGSYGLGYSYHYNTIDNFIYSGQSQQYINDNFVIEAYDNVCNDAITGVTLLQNDTEFYDENNQYYSVLELHNFSGDTCNQYYFEHTKSIKVLPNRE